ncbi:hypothetical protein [Burkholderia sp. BCC0322]|uniref:hypothetical protein n=1 Tax=unclassified Burkholderia TaxID=2613784 RepID=UPI00158A6949|nr:hypothetical protein [Burkholderia sp. BCC0322]
MSLLSRRLKATDARLQEIKVAQKTARKAYQQKAKQTRADRERKVMLVGEAVLCRLDRGEWEEAAFRQMMDEALSRSADRALFDLD